ncbi:MAG: NAD(P)/FAD-dependent oxidoreductase [Anaerolineae bacterium]|nr:NAD(P)/FAD-dependent oxidoreductase [Anaerolineae bacterium]MDW8098432.1 NAD(P)/FAD-dependent oxidoreductase [Anaerolineae bacterium]
MTQRVIVVGAGIGGLSAAAELALAGYQVTVLEAHTYPGGCAGTFYYQGYRFDAGATLAGGFAPGMPLDILARRFGIDWQARQEAAAMQVHLTPGDSIVRWNKPDAWQEERLRQFGPQAEPFWEWQSRTAELLWDLAKLYPAWPPQSLADLAYNVSVGWHWLLLLTRSRRISRLPGLLRDALTNVCRRLPPSHSERLRRFVDAQLLISAQATSQRANALFAAAALDLSRTGVGHTPGGIGSIAWSLAEAINRLGGVVHYRQEVVRVRRTARDRWRVETRRGLVLEAEQVVFNLPPPNVVALLAEDAPSSLYRARIPKDGWGAFVLYLGVDASIVPSGPTLHHQLLLEGPVTAGNAFFLSFSPSWDESRAPAGRRALTISTHTSLDFWWQLYENDRIAYEQHKQAEINRILAAAERFLPGLRDATDLILSGTPVTFQRFTRRCRGWVGGYPQTHLLRTWSPRLGPGLWLVGDSIFPGQSIPAAVLGGLRVATYILQTMIRRSAGASFTSLTVDSDAYRRPSVITGVKP